MIQETCCRVLNCYSRVCENSLFPYYCLQHSDELSDSLFSTLDGIVKLSSEIYIGRSYHPERRLLEHFINSGGQRTNLTILHWAGDHAEIRLIEERFIDHYKNTRNLLKICNDSSKSEGSITSPWNCLYASWGSKADVKFLSTISFHEIKTLSFGNRLWPDRSFPLHPKFLKAGIKLNQAEDLLLQLRNTHK